MGARCILFLTSTAESPGAQGSALARLPAHKHAWRTRVQGADVAPGYPLANKVWKTGAQTWTCTAGPQGAVRRVPAAPGAGGEALGGNGVLHTCTPLKTPRLEGLGGNDELQGFGTRSASGRLEKRVRSEDALPLVVVVVPVASRSVRVRRATRP